MLILFKSRNKLYCKKNFYKYLKIKLISGFFQNTRPFLNLRDMNNNRRKFLQSSSLLATAYLFGKPLKTFAGISTNTFLNQRLPLNAVQIIHTNDLHGRLHPFAFGDLHNIGGLHNIHDVIKNKDIAPVLVDSGDFLDANGSFSDHINMISQMNKVKYTAVTIGDKELKQGEAYLASLVQYMNFSIVNCNYSFSNPVLKAKVRPYLVVRFGQYKVGITGVGTLVSAKNITFSQPYKKANEVAGYLKNKLNCDLVICLSHLGLENKNDGPNNRDFAIQSENIDVIIGGNEKAVMHPQLVLKNKEKKQVIVSTGGFGGSILGTLTFSFNKDRGLQNFNCKNYIPGTVAGSSFYDNYKKLTA